MATAYLERLLTLLMEQKSYTTQLMRKLLVKFVKMNIELFRPLLCFQSLDSRGAY